MPRAKLTQQQMELIALLPKAIKQSKDFTNAQKLVLGQIDLQDGTNFSAENHYVFSSNVDLMKNTGIASENTIIKAVKRLVNAGLIKTRRGYRKKGEKGIASEYILTDKYYELQGRENPHKQGCNKDCNNIIATTPSVEALQQEINKLREEIQFLKNECQKSYCSPEPDIDTDIETVHVDSVYKNRKSIIRKNSSNNTVSIPGTVHDENIYKEKKNKRKKESNTARQGSLGSEGISNFSFDKNNKLHGQGELDCQGFLSDGVSSVFNLTMEEQGLNGRGKHSATPSVRSREENNELHTSNNMKDSLNTGDRVTLHPTESVSDKLEISAAAGIDNSAGSLLGYNILPDGVLCHSEKKRSPEAPGCEIDASCDGAAITDEAVNAILHVLDEFNTGGVKVTKYKPHMYAVELNNPVVWIDFIEELHNYNDRNKIYTKFDLRKNNKGKQYKKFRIYTS